MKTDFNSFLYKQKKNKLKKLLFNDEAKNKTSNKKINYCIKKAKDNMDLLDTDKNNEIQNSVIHKYDMEKFKNSFKTLKNSFNLANSDDNSKLFNQLKETKENIPFNGLNRGLLSTKSKKINSSLNKYINKKDLYHNNNSCIKKLNLKGFNNCNINNHNNRYNNLEINILGSKNKTVLKNLSNTNCKNINKELKTKKNIKANLLNFELDKHPIFKNNNKTNNNNACSHNSVQNYYTQKNTALNNKLLYSVNLNLKDSKTNINDFKENNIFSYNEEKQVELTKDEKILYGDRIMKGYSKIKLLGKGGYGIVWLCNKSIDSNENDMNYYAIKQTSKKKNPELSHNLNNILSNARNEITVLNLLNNNIDNEIELNYSEDDNNNYCELIPKIYDSYEDNNDIWFSFEKGGISLSNLCFKIKGEFEKGERIYLIQKGQFLEYLFSDINHFKYLLKQLVIGINYINNKGIIHSDIKPENILIDFSQEENCFKINSIKIIDYGSAFLYNEISSSTTSNTPEYLCPEITVGNKKFIKDLSNNMKYINAVDIWSLGITFLELCLCCPIWMNFKSKISMKGKKIYTHGIFGCRMRDSNKIYQKQVEVSKNLKKLLNNSLLYMFEKEDRDNFIDLLGKMLNIDYTKRINSQNILKHPFLNNNIE